MRISDWSSDVCSSDLNRQRRRRRFWWSIAKWTLALVLVLAAGAYSYRFGAQLAEREVVVAQERIVELNQEVAGLQEQSAALATDLAKAREGIAAWQARYQREVPTGFVRGMMTMEIGRGSCRERVWESG